MSKYCILFSADLPSKVPLYICDVSTSPCLSNFASLANTDSSGRKTNLNSLKKIKGDNYKTDEKMFKMN